MHINGGNRDPERNAPKILSQDDDFTSLFSSTFFKLFKKIK